jgi:hypothetical protein
MKIFKYVSLLLVLTGAMLAQTVSVTLQVTDAGAQTWNNGTWSVQLTSAVVSSNNYYVLGTTTVVPNQSQSGVLNGTGGASLTVTPNSSIAPSGSRWTFNVCPQATASCYQYSAVINSTQTLTIAPPAILINMVNPPARVLAYADGELSGQGVGATYYNLTSATLKSWSGVAWVLVGGGGAAPAGTGIPGVTAGVWNATPYFALNPTAPRLTITNTPTEGTTTYVLTQASNAAACPNGATGNCTTYTGTGFTANDVGSSFSISGFDIAANNGGPWLCVAQAGGTTIALTNTAGSSDTHAGLAWAAGPLSIASTGNTIENDGFIGYLPDGTFIYVDQLQTGWANVNSSVQFRLSFDQGQTWSAANIVLQGSGVNSYYCCSGGVTNTGRVIGVYNYQISTVQQGLYMVYSDNVSLGASATWSTPTQIVAPAGLYTVYGNLVTTANNTLVLAIYNATGPAVITSTNNGITWSAPILIDSSGNCSEAGIAYLGGSDLVAVMRGTCGGGGQMGQSISTTNGTTWNAATAMPSGITNAAGTVIGYGDSLGSSPWLNTFISLGGRRIVELSYDMRSLNREYVVYADALSLEINGVTAWEASSTTAINSPWNYCPGASGYNGYQSRMHPYDTPYGIGTYYTFQGSSCPGTGGTYVNFYTLPLNHAIPNDTYFANKIGLGTTAPAFSIDDENLWAYNRFGGINTPYSNQGVGTYVYGGYHIGGTSMLYASPIGTANVILAGYFTPGVLTTAFTGSYNLIANMFGGAGLNMTSGSYNSLFGRGAGTAITTGSDNTGIGSGVSVGTTSAFNTAIGYGSAAGATAASGYNTAVGSYSIAGSTTTGCYDTAVGAYTNAGTTGCENIMVGEYAVAAAGADSWEIVLGGSTTGAGSNTTTIGSTSHTTTVTLIGTRIQNDTTPTASAGSIATWSTDEWGAISALSGATTTTVTFAARWGTAVACTASASTTLATNIYVSAISTASVTFTMPALTGTLYYTCGGK